MFVVSFNSKCYLNVIESPAHTSVFSIFGHISLIIGRKLAHTNAYAGVHRTILHILIDLEYLSIS